MKCDERDLLLYAVTDRSWLNGRTLREQVEEALKGGATFMQLREKELDQDAFLEEARQLKALCAAYHVPFVINDSVEIAAAIDADGVHVGQSDMEAGDVRAKLGPDKIIGVSAQTVEQALAAEARGADYLGVGAVFHTGTKADATDVSYETLKEICRAVKIPVIGNGDVFTPEDAKALLDETGCDGIMVARGAKGNPWIFSRINRYLETGEVPAGPTVTEIREMILRHSRMLSDFKGERVAMREMRSHMAWYTTGLPHSAAMRREINEVETIDGLIALLDRCFPSES